MTADQKFSLLLTAIGLLFTMLTLAIGMIWRNGNKQGQQTSDIKNLVSDVSQIARDLDRHIQWHLKQRTIGEK
jgi:hypothetical protein